MSKFIHSTLFIFSEDYKEINNVHKNAKLIFGNLTSNLINGNNSVFSFIIGPSGCEKSWNCNSIDYENKTQFLDELLEETNVNFVELETINNKSKIIREE